MRAGGNSVENGVQKASYVIYDNVSLVILLELV